MSLIYAFLSIVFVFNLCDAQRYYQYYKLQDYDLCQGNKSKNILNLFFVPKIELSFTKAINIRQIWDSSTIPNVKLDCKFRVKTLKKNGIYAVITKLKFRRDKITNNCRDYIEFSHGHYVNSQKICNEYGTGDENDKIFFDFDRREEMQIKIHVDNSFDGTFGPLELEMYLTSHGICTTNGFPCNPNDRYSCIYKELVNDNIPNCMTNCTDEESCFYIENIKKKLAESLTVDYSHIVISAVTSLIFTMFAVGTIIYTCWKYWYVCYPIRPAEPTENNDIPTIEFTESPFNNSSFQSNNLDEQRPPSPKDLPPSYEELFPER